MHEITDRWRERLVKAIVDLPNTLQDALLKAAEPAFLQMEANEFRQWKAQQREERYFKFVENTELSKEDKALARVLRYANNPSEEILLKLIDAAISHINEVEDTIWTLNEYM